MKNKIYLPVISGLVTAIAACNPTPPIDDTMLDSGKYSFAVPDLLKAIGFELHCQSYRGPENTPVIIAAHGYSATTFDELRDYADPAKTFYVSQVLLVDMAVRTPISRASTGKSGKVPSLMNMSN